MTTPKKDKDKPTSTPKKPAGIKAEIDKGKAELTDDELKKVAGGVQPLDDGRPAGSVRPGAMDEDDGGRRGHRATPFAEIGRSLLQAAVPPS